MKHTDKKTFKLPAESTLVDTHCHLDMNEYHEDFDEVMATAAENGINKILTIGIDLDSSRNAVKLARRYDNIYAAIGIHPHNVANVNESDYVDLARMADDPKNKIVGYGEIGLDYFRDRCPREVQLTHFERQLNLAKELALPIIIHDRDAHEDVLSLLHKAGPFPTGGVMHCFSGDISLAHKVMELGLHISIPGIVTFKKSEIIQEVARTIPLDRMVLETDGPFLTPVPYRSKRNQPSFLRFTAAKVAELREISVKDIAHHTTKNAHKLFGLGQFP
ncbi:MAG: TatD family hydrolase [Desulfobulbaceae bacterium]|nr:TatD family hydrolase [Desulfobulbaceae bacterium]